MSLKRGFIGTIILIIVALALLKYFFGFDVLEASQTPQGQSTVGYIKAVVETVWSYISGPVVFVWDKIIWPILNLGWTSLQALLHTGQVGGGIPDTVRIQY